MNGPQSQMSERAKLMLFAGDLDKLFDQIWSIAKSKEAKLIAYKFTQCTLIVRKDLVNGAAKLPE